MWRMVFKGVIKPIFDDVLHQLQNGDSSLAPVVANVVLRCVKELRTEHLQRYLPRVLPLLSELVGVGAPEVRAAVRDILVDRVCPLVANLAEAAPLPPSLPASPSSRRGGGASAPAELVEGAAPGISSQAPPLFEPPARSALESAAAEAEAAVQS